MLRFGLLQATVCSFLAVELASAAQLPRPSPEFAIGMNSGQPIHLSQYKGEVCVLAFILTTCPHCQKTVGYLSGMQKKYGPQGLQVVANAIDDMGAMNVPDFIKRFQPPFPVGFSLLGDAQAYLQQPAIFRLMMPQIVFIDRQGIIRAQYAGDDKFFAEDQDKHIGEQIEALLKDVPTARKKRAASSVSKKTTSEIAR
jgi:thiol-disulfide isomerase/thioredoxin